MRLLNTESGRFAEFPNPLKRPPYAILSYTWDPDGEQTYQELKEIQDAVGAAFTIIIPTGIFNSPFGANAEHNGKKLIARSGIGFEDASHTTLETAEDVAECQDPMYVQVKR